MILNNMEKIAKDNISPIHNKISTRILLKDSNDQAYREIPILTPPTVIIHDMKGSNMATPINNARSNFLKPLINTHEPQTNRETYKNSKHNHNGNIKITGMLESKQKSKTRQTSVELDKNDVIPNVSHIRNTSSVSRPRIFRTK